MLNQSHTVDVSSHKLSHTAEVLSTQAAETDSRIINIGLLNEHQKEVAAHAATCNVYQSKIQPLFSRGYNVNRRAGLIWDGIQSKHSINKS